MTRTKKLTLLLAVLIVVMAASMIAVKYAGESTEEETKTIFTLNTGDAISISYTYAGETMTFVSDGESWEYSEDDEFPLEENYINTMIGALGEVVSYRTIEEPDDLDQYGLEDPECSIEVTTETDGEEKTASIMIGSESGLDDRRYISVGDGNVYMVEASFLDSFAYELYDLIAKEDIPSMSEIKKFTIETEEQTLEFDFLEESGLAYTDDYIWFLNRGNDYITLDTDLTYDLTDNITAMSWGDCVDYRAGENPGAYGLDRPAATVTVEYMATEENDAGEAEKVKKEFTVEIGDYVGDYCYARIAGSDLVYLIDSSIADAMLYAETEELLPDEVLLMDWEEVTAVDVSLEGVTYHFEKAEETVTDDDGNETTQTVWQRDGKESDVQNLLDSLTDMASTGSTDSAEAGDEAQISFVIYRDREDFSQVELDFYRYNGSSSVTSLDGDMRLLVSKDSVDALIEELQDIVSD